MATIMMMMMMMVMVVMMMMVVIMMMVVRHIINDFQNSHGTFQDSGTGFAGKKIVLHVCLQIAAKITTGWKSEIFFFKSCNRSVFLEWHE